MRGIFRSWLFYAWLFTSTTVLSYVLGNNPNILPFINPSETFALWLVDMYGSSNGEELADLELWYVVVCSFFIVFVLTVAFLLLKSALNRVKADD